MKDTPAPTLVPRLGPAVADYPPGSSFGPRDARFYEFVWILRGSARWDCGDLHVPLAPGALLLVRPGMRDTFRWDPLRPTRHAYAHFQLVGDGDGAEVADADWPVVAGLGGRHDPMAALCGYLLRLGAVRPPFWREHAEAALRLLLLTFVAGPERHGAPGGEDGPAAYEPDPAALPEPVVALMAAVRERWADGTARPLSLAAAARAAGVSPSTLSRLFRRRFGVGPVAALERLRLARAEPLLWLSNLSLRSVAVQCGFADAYHFSRRFTAVYGVAPSTFRATPPEAAPASPLESGGLTALAALVPPGGTRQPSVRGEF